MSNIKFDNINLLYMFIPLFVFIVIPFFISIRKKKLNIHNILSLFLHLLICALISITASGIKTEDIKTETIVYILADVSSTAENVVNQMDDYIEEFNEKLTSSSKLGIVAFAKEAIEYVKPGANLKSLENVEIDKSATNIQDALTYTYNLFDQSYKKRIVLLSDGKQTDGDATISSKLLNDNNVRIDCVYFNSDLTDSNKEVQVDCVKYSNSTFKNSESEIEITIISSYDTKAKLIIYDNNEKSYDEEIDLIKGENKIVKLANTSQNGIHNYQVSVQATNDECLENNNYHFSQEIHEKCEIAVFSNTYKEAENIKSMIQDNANVTSFIAYETNNISTSLETYMKYDQFIFSDLKLYNIKNNEDFVSSIEALVANFGKSLITLGGENTYYDGNFYDSKLKDMLPVNISPEDTKQRAAVMLVIDNSGSMDTKLAMAKQGAIKCLDVLTDKDYVGVITFEDVTKVAHKISILDEVNRAKITSSINKIKVGSGTMMTPGLAEAYKQMSMLDSSVSNKEVIIISDGVPSDSGQEEIVKQMAEDGIIVSTINIGSITTESLLQRLAKVGNGNFYTVTNIDKLPDIMRNEVTSIVMDTIIEGDIPVKIIEPSDKILEGINNIPNIKGYNYSKAKYNTTTILSTTLKLENQDVIEDVPLYTYWNYGIGKVSSFMSGISKWCDELFSLPEGKKMFNQMIVENRPKTIKRSYIETNVITNGYTSKIEVSVPIIISKTKMTAKITSPSGEIEELDLVINNGKYVQIFNTSEIGNYSIDITYINERNLNVTKYNTYFAFSYSSEYDKFEKSDNLLLWEISENSGVVTNVIDEIVNIEQEAVITNKYYYKPLLLSALILFIIDVIIRKLRWKDIINLFKRKSNKMA